MKNIIPELNRMFELSEVKDIKPDLCSFVEDNLDKLSPNWHALGFMHCLLGESKSGATFRLHLWRSNFQHSDEQPVKIHDHRFDVESRVLVGAVENVAYKFNPASVGEFRVRRVIYTEKKSSMIDLGEFGTLKKISSEVVRSPNSYLVHKFNLHETRLVDISALTFVRTSSPSIYNPRVVFDRNSSLPPDRVFDAVNKQLWMEQVRTMLSDR